MHLKTFFILLTLLKIGKSEETLCDIGLGGTQNYTCASLKVPWTLSRSGGSCLAILTLVGTQRAAILNKAPEMIFLGSKYYQNLPAVVSSSSGGTIFTARWAVLESFPVDGKFTYPCYKLTSRFREICVFHSPFGVIGDVCDAEYFNVFMMAFYTTFGKFLMSSTAQVSQHFMYYFIFVNTLPITPAEKSRATAFMERYGIWQGSLPETWAPGIDLVSPKEGTPAAPFNYGMPANLPRAYYSLIPLSKKGSCDVFWRPSAMIGNMSVVEVVTQSANLHGIGQLLPFSLNGNNWDSTSNTKNLGSLKVLGLTITFVMIRRALAKGAFTLNGGGLRQWPLCDAGCPTADIGLIDNGPMTTAVAYASWLKGCNTLSHVHIASTASAFGLFNFYLGKGSLDVWTGAGGNACPFMDVSYCTALTDLRELVKKLVPPRILSKYMELSTAYAIWLPQNQFLAAFCGDPIAYDHFMGTCKAKSYCYMVSSILPNQRLLIYYTLQPLVILFSVLFLAPTALAQSFVHDFVPLKVVQIPAFRHMSAWFPNMPIEGKEKGGMGFFKAPGHVLMDYLTYGATRLTPSILRAKGIALKLNQGDSIDCDFSVYKQLDINSLTPDSFITAMHK